MKAEVTDVKLNVVVVQENRMTLEILLCNLRTIQKLLSQKYPSLTELLSAAEEQAIQLLGDVPHPLIKVPATSVLWMQVLNEAQAMCDPNKIK